MTRRFAVLALAVLLAACGRRGRLRLPEPKEGEPAPPRAPSAIRSNPRPRTPPSAGLEIG